MRFTHKHPLSALFVAFFLMSFTDRISNYEDEYCPPPVSMADDHGDPTAHYSSGTPMLGTANPGKVIGKMTLPNAQPAFPSPAPMYIEPGACIVDLGITTSYNAGLAPYGLVYDIVKNNKFPVLWAIDPNKTFVDPLAKQDQIA